MANAGGNLQMCEHTANGAVDSANDGCEWYDENPSSCGIYDTDLF